MPPIQNRQPHTICAKVRAPYPLSLEVRLGSSWSPIADGLWGAHENISQLRNCNASVLELLSLPNNCVPCALHLARIVTPKNKKWNTCPNAPAISLESALHKLHLSLNSYRHRGGAAQDQVTADSIGMLRNAFEFRRNFFLPLDLGFSLGTISICGTCSTAATSLSRLRCA